MTSTQELLVTEEQVNPHRAQSSVQKGVFKKWWGYDWENSGRDTQGVGEAGRFASGARPGDTGQAPGMGGYGNQGARYSAQNQEGSLAREFTFINDRTGEPRVFLHGTRDRFTVFDESHPNKNDLGWLGRGHYFTSDDVIEDLMLS